MKRNNRVSEYFSTEQKIYDLDWKEVFDLKNRSKDYVAQGIVKYKDFIRPLRKSNSSTPNYKSLLLKQILI